MKWKDFNAILYFLLFIFIFTQMKDLEREKAIEKTE